MPTMEAVAQVLDVKVEKLLRWPTNGNGNALVVITIRDELYSSPTEARHAIAEKILEVVKEAKVVEVRLGSIHITFELPVNGAKRVVKRLSQGWLSDASRQLQESETA